ncbi:hypothetical protein [Allonocardiopsis opalescens]|uniref:Uncharacterized protein n=1 Tax=Allonocardiopsis opalescens TaxID=1144618 RepID=A0A2T0Q760_9ACTN|nr:hypothetical protein [Allonocardiopsis opalescens]PRX99553.1 hypothetical protein CLV72_103154 [Allonocardiopsis opalescens]
MSRTDKTKPVWVRFLEHGPRPVHDHRYGPCDLPPALTREESGTRCRWMPAIGQTCCLGPNGRAAKREMGDWRRAHNRRDRYAARLEARRYATGELDD